jgi:hypothetical protein
MAVELLTIDEARRAAAHILEHCPDSLPGLMTVWAAEPNAGGRGYEIHLYRAAFREATQGEGCPEVPGSVWTCGQPGHSRGHHHA